MPALAETLPEHWCPACKRDLQSAKTLTEHKTGRKHLKRAYNCGLITASSFFANIPHYSRVIDEEELWDNLASGVYRNNIVLTGAGVSTAAGVPEYRSHGGFFETMARKYADRFPGVSAIPESLFSRGFVEAHPDVWENELLPSIQEMLRDLQPALAHKFCAYLAHQGWLKRVYTQNIDGLHLHPSLNWGDNNDSDRSQDMVVECHGSICEDNLVLYGDALLQRFTDMVSIDFDPQLLIEERVDLMLVIGTSLQVAPFCGLANMAPKYCTRVLINRNLHHCMKTPYGAETWVEAGYKFGNTTTIGSCKSVSLSSHWADRTKIRKKKWRQLLAENDCDAFIQQYADHTGVVL